MVDPFAELDLAGNQDERVRTCVILLLNLVDELRRENAQLRAENQRLREEINRLTGEQGKPPITGGNTLKPPPAPTDYSSEQRRHVPRAWAKGTKTDRIRIDREQTLVVDPAVPPTDAQFKGHEDVVVQDIVFGTDNVLFHQEKLYSPGAGTTYLAPLPASYTREFGPSRKALALALSDGANVSEPKIAALDRDAGIVISDGQVSNLLISGQAAFDAEKAAIAAAGLARQPVAASGRHQHARRWPEPLLPGALQSTGHQL